MSHFNGTMNIKSLLSLTLLILFSAALKAQIPNAGFESWTAMTGYNTPDQWGNLNLSTSAAAVFTVTKGTSGPAAGSAYVQLTTKGVGSVIKPGIIVSGQLDTVTLKPLSGFAFTSRPEKLTGKWQHMGYGADAATISAWLTKWNSASHQRDTIASLNTTASGMLHTWGIFSIAFTYYSSASPDTAVIQISSSGNTPVKYSFVWIDELAFEGNVLAVDPCQPVSGVSLYPNPSSDFVYINYYSSTNEVVDIKFMDNIGNLVSNTEEVISAGHNQILLNLESHKIHPGIYIVQLISSQGTYSRKLVIKK